MRGSICGPVQSYSAQASAGGELLLDIHVPSNSERWVVSGEQQAMSSRAASLYL
jgi:hypothetical protein